MDRPSTVARRQMGSSPICRFACRVYIGVITALSRKGQYNNLVHFRAIVAAIAFDFHALFTCDIVYIVCHHILWQSMTRSDDYEWLPFPLAGCCCRLLLLWQTQMQLRL